MDDEACASCMGDEKLLLESVLCVASLQFLDLAIGGHHSVVLLAVRQPASGNFATRVRAAIKGGSWQDFNLVPSVYAWGWGDRGQLGEKQSPREQGMTCVGPLKFVDRVFRDTMDLQTGEFFVRPKLLSLVDACARCTAISFEGKFKYRRTEVGHCFVMHLLQAI